MWTEVKFYFKMSLDSLPFEVICLVASYLPQNGDLFSLLRCNRVLHYTVTDILYKRGGKITHYVLPWLLEGGFERGIQHLISRNNLDVNITVSSQSSFINTPLLIAIALGRTNIVELLLRNGAQVNLGTHMSTLEYAATLGYYDMTGLLLQHGAHVNLVDTRFGLTPLGCAMDFGATSRECNPHLWTSDILYGDRAKFQGENEFMAVIKLLLAHGADLHFQSDPTLSTCLHRIPKSPLKSIGELFRLFIDYGADLNAQDSKGNTPLHVAFSHHAFKGDMKVQKEFVSLLLRSGTNVNIKNHYGETPLHISLDNPGILEILLKPGANTRCRGKSGGEIIWKLLRTPWQTQKKGTKQHTINTILIELLLEHGACADQIIDGRCPLELHAAERYPVLKDLMVKRKMAPRKAPLKKSYQAPKDSREKRKEPTKPTRILPKRRATEYEKITEPTKPMRTLRTRIPHKA